MTGNVVINVQAALVLLSALAAWVFLPHELLRPVALVLLAFGAGGVFAVRAYLRRLHEVVAFLESPRHTYQPNVLSALLSDLERQFLRLGTPIDAGHAIGLIRERQSLLTLAGTSLGIVAIGAGLIVLMAYAA